MSSTHKELPVIIRQIDELPLVEANQTNIVRCESFEFDAFLEPMPILAADPSVTFADYNFSPLATEIGYTGHLYQHSEYASNSWDSTAHFPMYSGYPSSQEIPIPQKGADALYQTRYVEVNSSANHSYLETIPVPISDHQLQCKFLEFLMQNPHLLNSVTRPTSEAMALIEYTFAEDIRQQNLSFPLANIKRLFRQFKPVVGSSAIRHESNKKMTQVVKRACPFGFCENHFTRAAGIKNHLSAHFGLAPYQCARCRKCYSYASFRRHESSCRNAGLYQTSNVS